MTPFQTKTVERIRAKLAHLTGVEFDVEEMASTGLVFVKASRNGETISVYNMETLLVTIGRRSRIDVMRLRFGDKGRSTKRRGGFWLTSAIEDFESYEAICQKKDLAKREGAQS